MALGAQHITALSPSPAAPPGAAVTSAGHFLPLA